MSSPVDATRHAASACRTHRMYRMDCTEFDLLRARADGRCEVCRTPEHETTTRQLAIDHDHQYGPGAVRGLVCSACNSALVWIDRGRSTQDPRFAAYLANSWFMQVTAWARASGQLFWSLSCGGFDLVEAARKFGAVVSVERALGVEPTMSTHTSVGPGRVTFCATALFAHKELDVQVVIGHGTARNLRVEEVVVSLAGQPTTRFPSSASALAHLRAGGWSPVAPR
ncbi:endonuclease domain-containing protein [Streptomyces tendae]|uniref:endonuclease domain-containing protein n=1 Tax=Streptomyces tendae TaxID=1932 RepID=UPI003EBDC980